MSEFDPAPAPPGAAKRQRIEHLSQREWLLRRPDTFVGAITPTELRVPHFGAAAPAPPDDAAAADDAPPAAASAAAVVVASPALLHLTQELASNALDNATRDGTQRYIRIDWDEAEGLLRVANDGSTLPVERGEEDGRWAPTLAFGEFQSGSNFDDEEVRLTAGRNGFGAKGCNVFSRRFTVSIHNASDRKFFSQTWTDNMATAQPARIVASARKTNETRVEWAPDAARLGPLDSMPRLTAWLAHNASLCAPTHVKVSLNGTPLRLRTPEHFCRALGGVAPFANDVVRDEAGREVLRICVAARAAADADAPPGLTYAFVNATPCAEGSHARLVLQKVADVVSARARKKCADAQAPPAFVRTHAVTVAVLLVPNPHFTSQTKGCLDTPANAFGWRWEPGAAFRSALERSALAERAAEASLLREAAAASRATKMRTRAPSIAKYEPALRTHKGRATLMVTEGDSAKNFAVAGFSVVGRQDYGVYPVRGKFLNVRGLSPKAVLENKEARELLQILGLQLGHQYDAASAAKLPYRRLMVLADQDVDGSHIAALVYNLIDACAPSLLRVQPDFVCRFATSLIRVTLPGGGGGKGKVGKAAARGAKAAAAAAGGAAADRAGEAATLGFFSQVEYDKWRAAREGDGLPVGKALYYKGLGTSSAALAKDYFRDLGRNTVVLRHTGEASAEALDLFFNKKRADDRKAFLTEQYDPSAFVDYAADEIPVERFVRDELLPQYAMASVHRAIPSALDGFKVSTRKIFFGARSLKMYEDISVANAAGKIASHTNYHHRGTALEDALVGMAADYAGASNLNLFLPHGQFGTRHNHEAASAAYPKTCLDAPLHALLFPPADDALLEHVIDEGASVEPVHYVPVIATVLCFGVKGIATGWSTEGPMYDPLEVLRATRAWLEGGARHLPELTPWYRGFGGTVTRDPAADPPAFVVRGAYERRGRDVHVTELPPFKETDAVVEEWRKREVAAGGVVPGERATDEVVHLVLRDVPETCDVAAALGLEKRVTLQNLHLLDATGTLRRFTDPRDVVCEHARVRLDLYRKRLERQAREREQEAHALRVKEAFVRAVLEDRFDPRRHAGEEEAAAALRALLAPEVAEPIDDAALLKMPFGSLTARRVEELKRRVAAMEKELADLLACTPEKAWHADLDALERHLASTRRV